MTATPMPIDQQRRFAGWLAALSLWMPAVFAPIPALAQSRSLDFPSSGVICDRAVRICYDRNGVSLPLTRRYFDRRAEQNLQRQLAGRPIPREFQFSGGEVCDVRRQICWDDGWQKTNVSNRLSQRLFGTVGTPGNQWGNNNWNQNQQASACELSQRGQSLFNGTCNLRRRDTPNGTAYSVELQDGRRFAFYNRQGQLVLRDGSGTWPARFSQRGNEVVFNWADLRLATRADGQLGYQQSYPGGYPGGYQQGYPQNSPQNYPPTQNPTGQFLQDLFNNLFR
jgi:hypothetical protein